MDQEQLKEFYRNTGTERLVATFAAMGTPLPEPAGSTKLPSGPRPGDPSTLEGWHPQAKAIEGFLASEQKGRVFSISSQHRVTRIEPTPEIDASRYDQYGAIRCIDNTWD